MADIVLQNIKRSALKELLTVDKEQQSIQFQSRSNECFLLMSANPQSNPRLWCHLILKVAMLYGVCNVSLWRHASTFHQVCVCECFHMNMCVWLGYRVCLHYTLFRLIWLALNRYWFPLLCSLRLSHSLSLPPCLPSTPFFLFWLCTSISKAGPFASSPLSGHLFL